ncbi:MAG: hypothetical protein WB586_04875 [Chthoniobacterales bacterium]
MKRLLLLLNIFALALGALATQSCENTSTGYRHYDGDRYSQSGYYNRNYYNGDPYNQDYNQGYYRSDRPSIDVHF